MIDLISGVVGIASVILGGFGVYLKMAVDSQLTGLKTRIALVEQQTIQHKELLEELRNMRSDITALQVQVAVSNVKVV